MTMPAPRLLIAGIGNIFLGDDAFGVEVARRLAQRSLPETVRVVDFGIRGIDLSFALLEDYESVILIDAAPRGEKPGTLYVLEPALPTALTTGHGSAATAAEPASTEDADPMLQAHNMDPVKVLRLAAAMGSRVQRVLLVGCEPRGPNNDDLPMQMSEPVQAAIEQALPLVESLAADLLAPTSGEPDPTADSRSLTSDR